jgi:hypothetical protein
MKKLIMCLLLVAGMVAFTMPTQAKSMVPSSVIQKKCDEGDNSAPDHFE